MNPEERFERIERMMEFLATHQAQTSSDLREMASDLRQMASDLRQTASDLRQMASDLVQLGRKVDSLADTTVRLAGFSEQIFEAVRETQRNLNALAVIVERHISNGHKHAE